MKTMVKKLSVLIAAIAAVCALGCCFLACGDNTDYASLNAAGWAGVSEKTWNKKEISYQHVDSSVRDPQTANAEGADKSLRSCCLVNLYADGTLLFYQLGVYNIDGLPDPVWYDESRHIAWAYFGFWELSEDGNTIDIWYYCVNIPEVTAEALNMATDGPVEKTDAFAEHDYAYHFSATKSGEKYVVSYENDNPDVVPKTLGMNTNAEEMVIRANWEFSSSIVYKTIDDFIASATKGSEDWIGI